MRTPNAPRLQRGLGKVNRPTMFFYLAFATIGRRARSAETEWSIKYEVSEDWEAEINYEIVLRELLKLVPVAE
ncbi:hypothetical protein LSAT2_031962 [Lamellibrachia satsuma]|nr:hypothetical protein LSAT2_031962 [Lamellibrachia satsuma]